MLCYFEKREQNAKCSVKEYVRRYKPKAVYDLDGALPSTSGANFLSIECESDRRLANHLSQACRAVADGRRLELHCVDVKEVCVPHCSAPLDLGVCAAR